MISSVLVIEDDAPTREGFIRAIAAADGLRVAGAAATLAEGLEMVDILRPDVMLVDLALPDGHGISLIRHAAKVSPRCLPMVVTIFDDDERVIDCIRAGAMGYLLKDVHDHDLVDAIREVCSGGSPISAAIARRLFRWIHRAPQVPNVEGLVATEQASSDPRHAALQGPALSEREAMVLKLCAKGYKYDEIAELLAVSRSTIATYIKRVYRKLQVRSKSEAVYEARQLGLLDD